MDAEQRPGPQLVVVVTSVLARCHWSPCVEGKPGLQDPLPQCMQLDGARVPSGPEADAFPKSNYFFFFFF